MNYTWSNLPEWVIGGVVSLSDLAELIVKLQKKYGKHSLVEFTAGANDINVLIAPTRKKIKPDNPTTSKDKLKNV